MSQPELKAVSTFVVAGESVRTCYGDEIQANSARLPGVWGRFFASGMGLFTPGRIPDGRVYGVYNDYASDEMGLYTLTAGVAVAEGSANHAVVVPAGEYLVFTGRGPMPQTIVQTWGHVWAYFQGDTAWQRAFAVDFETYVNQESVEIYISVISKESV